MSTYTASDYSAFALRVASGALFIAHGLTKLLVFTIPGTVGFFESLGIPGIFAYLTILAELGGGALLIAGVAVRPVSLALIPVLLGALWVHSGNGWAFSSQGGGWEYPAFWTVAQFAILLQGRGAFALELPVVDKTLGKFA
jgi:putative oxidoreductase